MKRKILIVVKSILGIVVLLFMVLVIHIATVKPNVYDNATMQISRIDFIEPLDSLKIKEIHRHFKTIPGFINDSYNLQKNVVVFFHDNRIADSKTIFDELMAKGKYKANRYIVPDDMKSKQVCPVIEKGSFSYHFSKGIQSIFN